MDSLIEGLVGLSGDRPRLDEVGGCSGTQLHILEEAEARPATGPSLGFRERGTYWDPREPNMPLKLRNIELKS